MSTPELNKILEAEIEDTSELDPQALEVATAYAVKSDVRAGQCPATFAEYRYKGTTNCAVAC